MQNRVKLKLYGAISSIPRGGVPIEGYCGLGRVYSKAISGHVAELFDNNGGAGDGDFPKPGSSLGLIFGKYWTVKWKISQKISLNYSLRLWVRLCLQKQG